jgi:hypothetical protein
MIHRRVRIRTLARASHEKPVAFLERSTRRMPSGWRETFLGFASEFSGRRYYRFRFVPSA